jgi:SAM-dependent methyltransferase
MSLKASIKRSISAIGEQPIVAAKIHQKSVRRIVEKIPVVRWLYVNEWERIHPFDRYHGTDTSGIVMAKDIPAKEAARAYAIDYAGSQPNVLRLALAKLPPLDTYTFVDLGCGKGRPLLVASEFSFRDILGVELSALLARVTQRNAEIVANRFPLRTKVRVAVGDASTYPLPAGNLVIFLYNPFKAELIANVVAGVEAALAAEARSIYIVYYNPVAGHCFDASRQLDRYFAKTLPYADRELGYGPDTEDPVVIWQGGIALCTPDANANARIVLQHELRAVLEHDLVFS